MNNSVRLSRSPSDDQSTKKGGKNANLNLNELSRSENSVYKWLYTQNII